MIFKRDRKHLDRVNSYKAVFGSEDGKRVLYDLMKLHHLLGPLPAKTADEMFRAEGERNVVLRIMSILNIDPIQLENRIKQGQMQDAAYNEE